MERSLTLRRDRLIVEADASLRNLRPNTRPTARQVDGEVERLNPNLHGKWAAAQSIQRRISTIRRVLREKLSRHISRTERIRGRRPGHQAASRAPLWFVGKRQRDDLRPNYQPVPPEPAGSFALQLLNRGRAPATDIEVRIGSTYRCIIGLIDPGERGDLLLDDDTRSFHALADLLGGHLNLTSARFEQGAAKEYRHLVRVRFRYNQTSERWLRGELRGTATRYFYKFKPDRGRATPIY